MDLVIPPRVPQDAIDRVQELSVEAFRVTNAREWRGPTASCARTAKCS